MVGCMEKRGRVLEKVCGGMEKRCRLAFFGTHTHMRRIEPERRSTRGDQGCAQLYAWGPGLRSG